MADELINGLIERQVKASAVYQKGVEDERERCAQLCEQIGLHQDKFQVESAYKMLKAVAEALRTGRSLNEPDDNGSSRGDHKENSKPSARVRSGT